VDGSGYSNGVLLLAENTSHSTSSYTNEGRYHTDTGGDYDEYELELGEEVCSGD